MLTPVGLSSLHVKVMLKVGAVSSILLVSTRGVSLVSGHKKMCTVSLLVDICAAARAASKPV